MMLRGTVRLLALLGLLGGSVACGTEARKQVAHKGKIILLNDSIAAAGGSDTLRIGRLNEGECAQLTLAVGNRTSRPMALTGYSATCGCTKLTYDNQPVMPGNDIPLTLTFDARGLYGWQFKLVELRLTGAAAPLKIYLEADVE